MIQCRNVFLARMMSLEGLLFYFEREGVMKKLSFSRLLWLFFLVPGMLVAADLSTKAGSVGKISLLIGSVIAIDGQGVKRTLKRGAVVYEKDTIETAAGGHAHLHFVDDGVVSLRPNSRLKIDSYVFDVQNPNQNSIRLNLETGVLRSISGQATKDAHERFRLNTPITAVGVLGTDFLVRTEVDKMWAAVFSGAIAVAPLDEVGCTTAGLGACSNALRLSAGMGDLMFEYDVQKGVNQIIKRDENLPNEKADLQGLGEQGLDALSRTDVNSSELNAAQQVKGLPGNVELSPFAWGRWGWVSFPEDDLSQEIQQARQGRGVTVADSYFSLYRDNTEVLELPWRQAEQYRFKLTKSYVHYIEKTDAWLTPTITKGTIDAGELSVNFLNQEVSTYLEMSHDVGGSAVLDLTGSIDQNGIITANDHNGSMAAGALSPQGQHAGLLFEHSVDGGVFNGISTWEKR
jgi:hypothetical protein